MVRNLTYVVSPTWSRARTDREVSVGGRVGGLSMCVARRAASLAAAQALHNARRSLSCCGYSLMLRLLWSMPQGSTCGDRVDHLCGTAVACVHMICITSSHMVQKVTTCHAADRRRRRLRGCWYVRMTSLALVLDPSLRRVCPCAAPHCKRDAHALWGDLEYPPSVPRRSIFNRLMRSEPGFVEPVF